MMKQYILCRHSYLLSLCTLFFTFSNTPYFVNAGLEGLDNILTEESRGDVTRQDRYVVLLDDKNIINIKSQRDVISLTNDIVQRYSLEVNETFSDGFLGFTATNLTKQDVESLQKEETILLVEKDSTIAVDNEKNITDTLEKISDKVRKNKRSGYSLRGQNDFIPVSIQQVGWANVEYDSTIMSRRVFIIDSGLSDPSGEFNIDTSMARNFISGENPFDWSDCHGHGTHIASTIAAKQNGRGVVGDAAGAVVVPIRVLDCNIDGAISDIARAIDYVGKRARPGDVVNLSIGGPIEQTLIDVVLEEAAERSGAYFVVSAGNGSMEARRYSPARVNKSNVYTVCATDSYLTTVQPWSNIGNPPVDICAPGTDIIGLSFDGEYAMKSGTSMAAPHVSGALLFGSLKNYEKYVKGRDGAWYGIVRK